MKFVIAIGVIALLIGGYITYAQVVVNPRVIDEITTNPGGERAKKVMLLDVDDDLRIPVNYLREGDTVYVGADGPWWRQFRDGGHSVELMLQGEQLSGHATVELNNQAKVDDVFSRLRPTAPEWLPDWLNGKLVIIELQHQSTSQ